jgi:hypothetical protein
MKDQLKTSIKERSLYVYVPNVKMAEKWKKTAKNSGISVSKFIIEAVEEYISEDKNEYSSKKSSKKISELEKQSEILRLENMELQKKVDMLNMLTDKYELQLREYRNKTFIDNGKFEGIREYQSNLIDLFKKRTSIKENEIIDLLHVNPTDHETMKAISKQIEHLEDYGFIKRIKGGCRWKK